MVLYASKTQVVTYRVSSVRLWNVKNSLGALVWCGPCAGSGVDRSGGVAPGIVNHLTRRITTRGPKVLLQKNPDRFVS